MSSIEKTGRDTIISSGQWIDLSKINRKVHKSDFIPPKIMQFCDTVISHAGNGTTYSALKYGTPTLGLPYNPDQVDNARSIERLGVGIIFYEYYDKPVDMSGSIERLSSNNDFKNNIKPLSRNVRKSEGRIRAADLIESYLRNKI
jgi:UDP:flavonoid glycosyltransferase YjiC (YdhE family)